MSGNGDKDQLSPVIAALSLAAPFWLLHLYLVFGGDPHRERTFGYEYERYRSKVPRYSGAPKR